MTNKFDRIHMNTNKKYIIRNCPNIVEGRWCYGKIIKLCEDCNNCVLKRIVGKCVDEINDSDRWSESRAFAQELLQLLDIQEVE